MPHSVLLEKLLPRGDPDALDARAPVVVAHGYGTVTNGTAEPGSIVPGSWPFHCCAEK